MNVLFLMKTFNIGGQEVVTSVLANEFLRKGYGVSVVVLKSPSGFVFDKLDRRIKCHVFDRERYDIRRVNALKKVLVEDSIDVVINQWGLPFAPVSIIKMAIGNLPIKVVSVYHNQPNINARIVACDMRIDQSESKFMKVCSLIERSIVTCVTRTSMRIVYFFSDAYVLLSDRHVKDFVDFTRIKEPSKVYVVTNPVTIDPKPYEYCPESKVKEILYVGRIDYNQKRVNRLVEVWGHASRLLPDWRFTIVGNGPAFESLASQFSDNSKSVSLVGFQEAKPYYERASMLIMTSEYEGLPLVLAEAMIHGVVPVVYGSFSSVYDIVEDGKSGVVINKGETFDPNIMANKIAELANDSHLLEKYARSSIENSKKFRIEPIVDKWMSLMSILTR